MQVAATHPTCLSKEDLSSAQREEAKRMGKSAEELAREVCLLEQPLIKDQGQTVAQLLASLIAKTGENIVVKRFARFTVGESP
jgi:elongation factor Ts